MTLHDKTRGDAALSTRDRISRRAMLQGLAALGIAAPAATFVGVNTPSRWSRGDAGKVDVIAGHDALFVVG